MICIDNKFDHEFIVELNLTDIKHNFITIIIICIFLTHR